MEGGREGGREDLLTGSIHHHDTLFCGSGEIDIVYADTSPADDDELVSSGDYIARHLRKTEGGRVSVVHTGLT